MYLSIRSISSKPFFMKSNTLKPLNTAIIQCDVNLKVVIRLRHDGLIEGKCLCLCIIYTVMYMYTSDNIKMTVNISMYISILLSKKINIKMDYA